MLTTILKPYLRSALLPTMLAASIALVACNDTSPANDTVSAVDNENMDNTDSSTTDMNDDNIETSTPVSAEEQMLDTLSNYRWRLRAATDNKEQPISSLMPIKEQVTLNFNQQDNHTLNYSVSCNIMSAAFKLQENKLTIEDSMSTKMSCGELDDAENVLNKLMQGDSQLKLTAMENSDKSPSLTQVTSNAETLVWNGKMTAQAKYNGKGKTIFWEVAAESKPCQDNNLQMCLQVRPITYDEQGIKTSAGEYTQFAGTIDGYQHDSGHTEVLRLQRFRTDKDTVIVDNVDSEFAYVLDTVIESTVIENASAE